MVKPGCMQCGRRVGWVGIGVNLVMVVMKIVVGLSAGSRACLADALHSSSNIVTAFAIFVSRKMIAKPVDDVHPYGHGKVEFIAAGAVSLLIIVLTIVLVVASLEHIIYWPVPPPHMTAVLVAVVSIATNEMMFRYFRCVGTELRSQTIIANAWANRADCFSSLMVVVGVVGAQFGFHHLDPVAAVVVAVIIVKVSVGCIRESVAGLMDRSVPLETIDAIRNILEGVEDVRDVQNVRARLLGDKIWVEVRVLVAPGHTVSECENIRERIVRVVRGELRGVGQVMVDFDSAVRA